MKGHQNLYSTVLYCTVLPTRWQAIPHYGGWHQEFHTKCKWPCHGNITLIKSLILYIIHHMQNSQSCLKSISVHNGTVSLKRGEVRQFPRTVSLSCSGTTWVRSNITQLYIHIWVHWKPRCCNLLQLNKRIKHKSISTSSLAVG